MENIESVSTAVAQVIERENAEVDVVLNARPDTTKACVNNTGNTVFTGYIPTTEEKSLTDIISPKIEGVILWAYLDTGSGRNFISSDAVEKLKLNPTRHKLRHIVTVNGVKKRSSPLFDVTLN